MSAVDAFLGAAILGLGLLLAAVAALAWRRASDRKMAFLAGAFVVEAGGGAALLLGELMGGELAVRAPLVLAAASLLSLFLLYVALFAQRR